MLKPVTAAVLAILCLFTLASEAFGGIKLTLKPEHNLETDETQYTLGLPVYWRFSKPVAYSGWFGYGAREQGEDDWMKTDQAFETYFGALAVAVGGTIEVVPGRNFEEKTVYAKLSWTLIE